MTEYRVTRKRVVRSKTQDPSYRDGSNPNDLEATVFEPGDVFEPTDEELEAFGDRLEEVHYPSDDTEDESEDEEGN